jgi:hypothetical protein
MISVTEEISLLTQQENQLHTSLDNLRGRRSKVKEHKQLEKELAVVLRKRQNLQAYDVFELGMPVHRLNSSRLGIVKELKITPGGMGEVWVSWDGLLQIPEQPNLLRIDGAALTKIIAVGDRIKIVDGHKEAGKTFTVERLLARGAVETTDEQIFEREEWQKINNPEVNEVNENEDLVGGNLTFVMTEIERVEQNSAEELGSLPEITVTVGTTAIATAIEELTEEEEKERHRLELKVERAFYEAGTALRKLRDQRLYRSTHKTFEEYCGIRFGFTRQSANYLIAGAKVFENLTTNGCQILPTTERQIRPLTKLESELQLKSWQQAVEQADGKVPSGRIVKGIVERLKEKPLIKANDFCTVGDPFILTKLEGNERKYNGCWAIASELRDFTIAVDVHDTTLAVKPDNLDPIDVPDARCQLPETLKRIRRLRETGLLSRCVYAMLESLGRQTYLDDFEAQLLTFMEQRYGIED